MADKRDERPVIQRGPGGEVVLPAQHRQRQHLGIGIFLAKEGHPEYLAQIFSEHEFNDEAVDYLLACIVPRRRGRPRGSTDLQLWAAKLEQIKEMLRREGHGKWRIHEDAMEKLEAEAPHIRRVLAERGLKLQRFNRAQLEAHVRRSKKPRLKKSRAK